MKKLGVHTLGFFFLLSFNDLGLILSVFYFFFLIINPIQINIISKSLTAFSDILKSSAWMTSIQNDTALQTLEVKISERISDMFICAQTLPPCPQPPPSVSVNFNFSLREKGSLVLPQRALVCFAAFQQFSVNSIWISSFLF